MTVALLPAERYAMSMREPSSFFFMTRFTSANGISRGALSASGRRPTVSAAAGRVDDLIGPAGHRRHAHLDLRLEVDLALIPRDAHLGEAREHAPLAQRADALAGHEVEAEDDVLRRHDDGLAVRRRQDVV